METVSDPQAQGLISPVRLSQLQASCREGSQLQTGISEAAYRFVTAQASFGTLLPPCAEVWASILEDANERKWPRASCGRSAQMTQGEVAALPCRLQLKSLTRCSRSKWNGYACMLLNWGWLQLTEKTDVGVSVTIQCFLF